MHPIHLYLSEDKGGEEEEGGDAGYLNQSNTGSAFGYAAAYPQVLIDNVTGASAYCEIQAMRMR